MARQLKAPVFVAGQWFRPGDPVPAEVADQLGDHLWIDDGRPDPTGPTPPPLGGAGSGIDAWAEYAALLGVDVEGLTKRDEIVSAISDAGHPVE